MSENMDEKSFKLMIQSVQTIARLHSYTKKHGELIDTSFDVFENQDVLVEFLKDKIATTVFYLHQNELNSVEDAYLYAATNSGTSISDLAKDIVKYRFRPDIERNKRLIHGDAQPQNFCGEKLIDFEDVHRDIPQTDYVLYLKNHFVRASGKPLANLMAYSLILQMIGDRELDSDTLAKISNPEEVIKQVVGLEKYSEYAKLFFYDNMFQGARFSGTYSGRIVNDESVSTTPMLNSPDLVVRWYLYDMNNALGILLSKEGKRNLIKDDAELEQLCLNVRDFYSHFVDMPGLNDLDELYYFE